MKPVSILIVEDKIIIAENLKETLVAAGYTIAGCTDAGEEALPLIKELHPDIILMDIQLAGKMDGIQTVEQINQSHSIPVIYLTDFHDQKTINRAKNTQPAAFLLKPFKSADLLIAIEIAFHNASNKRKAVAEKNEKTGQFFYPLNDRVFIKEKDTWHRIDLGEMLWIEAGGSYCNIKTEQKTFTLSNSLRVFNEKFNHPHLVRVHRSYVVNIDRVTAIKGNVLFIDKAEIPIGESYRDEIHQRFPML